jgi:hypothetical protein
MSKISFLNKHQIIFEIKMPDQFFFSKLQYGTDFGKRDELRL